jgi:micrococcal nuclease
VPGTLLGEVTHVRDGDTIEVDGLPIRLNGLAAPEAGEPGARAATRVMAELVQGQALRCELNGERTHDRCVATCYLDGQDISAEMVRAGVARDCPRFSGGRYAEAERQAAADGAMIRAAYFLPAYCRPRCGTTGRWQRPTS